MRNRARIPLKKAKVRQSWSKYNLYNLSRTTSPTYRTRTFFQQKWTAKSVLRTYHSEQVSEGSWEKMFCRKLRSVVPMQPEYLARNDGSLESAGRGSALKTPSVEKRQKAVPYMQMTFAPLERRLDTAVFRALFASSARQAKQFVVHGAVKVNGKKMRYPGYLLNPGDMFQVDPERVMFATGAPKDGSELSLSETSQIHKSTNGEKSATAAEDQPGGEGEGDKREEKEKEKEGDGEPAEEDPRVVLKSLLAQAKSVLGGSKEKGISAKRKQEMRGFQKQIKRQLSRSSSSTILTDSLEAQFQELRIQLLRPRNQPPSSEQKDATTATSESSSQPDTASTDTSSSSYTTTHHQDRESRYADAPLPELVDADLSILERALQSLQMNPVDSTKPYSTPWTPRPYMSAFAFIPRYLEVNPAICAAVYLRHPVARPGVAEVPTPFGVGTGGEAFAWYLRRR